MESWFRVVGKNYGTRSGISRRIDTLFPHLARDRILFHAGICLWRVYNVPAGKLYPFERGSTVWKYLKGGMKNGNWPPPRVSCSSI